MWSKSAQNVFDLLETSIFYDSKKLTSGWSVTWRKQEPGVRFSKLPRTFRARKHFGALFGCFSRVPKSVSQNTRKCPELSPDIFRESFRVTGYDNATRAGGNIILEHGFIITTFNFSS